MSDDMPCAGVHRCDWVHPYEPEAYCRCSGYCQVCSHLGCEACIAKAWRDRPWWRKVLRLPPGYGFNWRHD